MCQTMPSGFSIFMKRNAGVDIPKLVLVNDKKCVPKSSEHSEF